MSLTAAVEGVDHLVGTLDDAASDLARLPLASTAHDLAAAAEARTPRRTGRLADTVHADVVDQAVTLTAGGPGVAYAAIVHAGRPWLADTIAAQADQVIDHVTTEVDAIISTIRGAS